MFATGAVHHRQLQTCPWPAYAKRHFQRRASYLLKAVPPVEEFSELQYTSPEGRLPWGLTHPAVAVQSSLASAETSAEDGLVAPEAAQWLALGVPTLQGNPKDLANEQLEFQVIPLWDSVSHAQTALPMPPPRLLWPPQYLWIWHPRTMHLALAVAAFVKMENS